MGSMNSATTAIMLLLLALVAAYPIGAVLGLIYGLVSMAATKLFRLWNDHQLGPKRRGGRKVDAAGAPQLVAILQELSQRAGIPTPRRYVIDSPRANASAAGRDRRHASICVTTGLLYGLTPDELAGVLSHELAHVLQRSALIGTAAATLAAAISLLPLLGPFFGFGFGIGRSPLLLLVVLPAAVLGQLAIGRAGEYAADECGAHLCGRPDALAAALKRAASDDAELDEVASSQVATALLAFGKRLAGPRRDNPFSAYPLSSNRIAALERLAREMGSGGSGGRGSAA
jgi:heat shock protein HtpX